MPRKSLDPCEKTEASGLPGTHIAEAILFKSVDDAVAPLEAERAVVNKERFVSAKSHTIGKACRPNVFRMRSILTSHPQSIVLRSAILSTAKAR